MLNVEITQAVSLLADWVNKHFEGRLEADALLDGRILVRSVYSAFRPVQPLYLTPSSWEDAVKNLGDWTDGEPFPCVCVAEYIEVNEPYAEESDLSIDYDPCVAPVRPKGHSDTGWPNTLVLARADMLPAGWNHSGNPDARFVDVVTEFDRFASSGLNLPFMWT